MAIELTDTQIHRSALDLSGHTFTLTKAVSFEAAHHIDNKPAGHRYTNIHGHSFRLEVTVAGQVQPGKAWVHDFSDLTEVLMRTAAKLDHRLLNEIEGLELPTLERLALWIANDLKPDLPGLQKVEVSRPSLSEKCTLIVGPA